MILKQKWKKNKSLLSITLVILLDASNDIALKAKDAAQTQLLLHRSCKEGIVLEGFKVK
jgi:hypothetical protein